MIFPYLKICKMFRRTQTYLLIIAVIAGTLVLPANGQEDEQGFRNFLVQAMDNYPDWLHAKGLDPTPAIPHVVNLTRSGAVLFNFTGEARNQSVHGHSNVRSVIMGSSLISRNFEIGFIFRNYSITGEYEVEGTVWSNPVEGHGQFQISTNISRGNIFISNFIITPDGFIDLRPANYRYEIYLPSPGQEGSYYWFENLDAGGREDNLVALMYTPYEAQVEEWFPLREYVAQYLTELFDETPLAEIIETTTK